MIPTKATFAVPATGRKGTKRRDNKQAVAQCTAGGAVRTSLGASTRGRKDLKEQLFSKPKGVASTPKQKKKEALFQKKSRKNKSYGIVADITVLWEKIRPRDTTEKQRAAWIQLAMTRVKGHVPEVVQNPKASRVLQCCLQYGTTEDRMIILNEIHNNMAVLSMSKYGKHLVQRLINKTYGDDFDQLFRLFHPHCCRLLKHQYGSDVMNDLYCKADEFQRHELMLICYGREFHAALDAEWRTVYRSLKGTNVDPTSLEILLDKEPLRKAGVLQRLHGLLSTVIDKGLLVNRLVHRLILEFIRSAPSAHVEDLCMTLAETGDGLLKMVHTNEGSAVAANVLYDVDARRRKGTLRAFRDYVIETATDEWGHVTLIMAFRVCDDTKMLRMTLLDNIVGRLEEVCRHRYARRIVLDILHPECHWYLPPKMRSHLHPRSLEITNGNDVRVVGGSKSAWIDRRRALLHDGNPSLASALIDLCRDKTVDMLKCRRGCDVLAEAGRGGEGCLLDAEAVRSLHRSIMGACLSDVSLLNHRTAKGVLIQLINFSRMEEDRLAKHFCRVLWNSVFQGQCERFLESTVLMSLSTCGSKSVRTSVHAELTVLLKNRSVEDWLMSGQENKTQRRRNFHKPRRSNRDMS